MVGLVGCAQQQSMDPPCVLSQASVNFGVVESTGPGKTIKLQLRNNTKNVPRITISPLAAPFGVAPSTFEKLPPAANVGSVDVVVSFQPTDGLLHLDEFTIQSDDGQCDLTVPVRGLGSGLLRADPAKPEFTMSLGETQTRELRLINTRRVPLTVERPASIPELTVAFPEGFTIPAGGSVPLRITARMLTWSRRDLELLVTTALDRVTIPISLIPSSPVLEVTPLPPIDIPIIPMDPNSVPPGYSARTFRVRNAGTTNDPSAEKLIITGFKPTDASSDLRVTPVSFTQLSEGQSTDLGVRIVPTATGPRTFEFKLQTNVGEFPVTLTMRASLLPPCKMTISPTDRLTLHDVPDGGLEGAVTFTNVGLNACTVDGVRLGFDTPGEFSVTGAVSQQFKVLPNEQHEVTVSGPRSVDAGVIGALEYHVYQAHSDVQVMPLEAP